MEQVSVTKAAVAQTSPATEGKGKQREVEGDVQEATDAMAIDAKDEDKAGEQATQANQELLGHLAAAGGSRKQKRDSQKMVPIHGEAGSFVRRKALRKVPLPVQS